LSELVSGLRGTTRITEYKAMSEDLVFHSLTWQAIDANTKQYNPQGDSSGDEEPEEYKDPQCYIHCFGKKENGESVHLQIKFFPWCFIECNLSNLPQTSDKYVAKNFINDLPYYIKKELVLDSCTLVKRKKFMGFTNGKLFSFLRVVATTWRAIKFLEKFGRERGYALYETNVDPVLKMFHLKDLEACGWLRIPAREYTRQSERTTWCHHDFSCDFTHIESLPDKVDPPPFIIASFDIEVISVDDAFPDADIEGNEVIQIGTTLVRYGESEPFLKHLVNLGDCNPIGSDVVLECCETEVGVLNTWRKLLQDYHVDMLVGWNTWGFDMSYMYKRAVYNDYDCDFLNLGKFRDVKSSLKKQTLASAAYGHNEYQMVDTDGIFQIDLMQVFKRDHKLESYSLNKVSEHFLGEHKIDMPAKELFRLWRTGDPENKRLIGEYCFCQGTRVSLPSYTVDIACLAEINSDVVTWVEDKGFSTSQKIHFFDNGERDCIQLTFTDGTQIDCTKNHRFLTKNGWVEAQDLQDTDKILWSPEQAFVDYEKEKYFTYKFSDLTGELPFEKACTFCKILGYLLTDGGISDSICYKNYPSGRIQYIYTVSYIHLGTRIDAENMQRDIFDLIGKLPAIKKDTYTYKIVLPMELTKWFLSLNGIEKGKRLNVSATFPEFITDVGCPLWIIREFIKGLMGGDGGCPSFSEKDNKFSNVAFYQSKTQEHLESLNVYLKHLQSLFARFGISTILTGGKKNKNGEGYTQVLKISQDDMILYYEKIGYAYCIGKTYKLAVASAYYKLKRETRRQFQWVCDRTDILIEELGMSRVRAVEQAHSELKAKEPIFNSYYSLPNAELVRKSKSLRNMKKEYFPSVRDFLVFSESYEHFVADSGKKSHAVKQDEMYSPCFYLSVLHKQGIGKKPVYDIEVKDSHNFIANGAVVHNCVQDTALPAKLMDKLGNVSAMIEMSKATHVPVTYLITRGQQIKCFSQILKYLRHENIVCPAAAYGAKGEKFEGATVLPPKKGAYFDIVSGLDFASLYPSIMRAWSLCHTTLVLDSKYDNLEGVEYLTVETDGTVYRFAQNVPSILPTLLEDLAKFRKKAKRDMADAYARGDTFMASVYNGRQLAFKVSMNSIYGACGAANGYMPCVPIASSVTRIGRDMISHTKEMVEREYPGSEVVYGDSVMPYTPITFMQGGQAFVKTINKLNEAWTPYPQFKAGDTDRYEKEQSHPDDIYVWTHRGWARVVRVIRHKTTKTIYRILTHTGLVDVTEDHSLLDKNAEIVKPGDLSVGHTLLHSQPMWNSHVSDISTEQAYIYGMFVGDGSCGKYNTDNGLKSTWAINNKDYELLQRCQKIMETLEGVEFVIMDTLESSGVYKLTSRGGGYGFVRDLVELYRTKCYQGQAKCVPQEVLNSSQEIMEAFLRGLVDSDGNRKEHAKYGCLRIDTKNQVTAQSYVLLLQKLGFKTSINTRSDKPDIVRIGYTRGKQRKDPNVLKKVEVLHDVYTGYVYDLETEFGVFHAGVGNMIVKNTDSVFVRFGEKLPMAETFKIAEEAAALVSKTFKHPIELEFEKCYSPLFLFAKKRYVGNMYTKPEKADYIDAKGIQLVRRDNCPLVKKISTGIIDILMYEKDVPKAIDYTKTEVRKFMKGDFDIKDLILSKTLRVGYKNDNLPHVNVARKIEERDGKGSGPKSGNRVPFVFVQSKGKKDLGAVKAEDPDYAIQNGLKIDLLYYLQHQLESPICCLFELIEDDPKKVIFEDIEQEFLKSDEHIADRNKWQGQMGITSFFKKV
jgi:DNA polymerase elongation subunit (family B)/intein/homing endonuclease